MLLRPNCQENLLRAFANPGAMNQIAKKRKTNRRDVVSPVDVFPGRASVGKNIVVIGGGRIDVDTAYTLASKGLAESITIVEPLSVSTLAYDMDILNKTYMLMVLLPKYRVQGFIGMRFRNDASLEP